ncbi:MAG TPA: DUF1003 domain-containing protein [Candidatus Saccharimonadales bacterium]|nr:DUF1003 domain-containing protein [Candidatus Saccharimonadales bacterium]
MILNANKEIKRLKSAQDRAADRITSFAGTMKFVYIHSLWFGLWILANLGLFGAALQFDSFPFGLLTLIVSLEAIFLSTFVMISQNRQAKAAEVRSELDYRVNVKAEAEIDVVMKTLQRVAEKQGVKIDDLLADLEKVRKQDQ